MTGPAGILAKSVAALDSWPAWDTLEAAGRRQARLRFAEVLAREVVMNTARRKHLRHYRHYLLALLVGLLLLGLHESVTQDRLPTCLGDGGDTACVQPSVADLSLLPSFR